MYSLIALTLSKHAHAAATAQQQAQAKGKRTHANSTLPRMCFGSCMGGDVMAGCSVALECLAMHVYEPESQSASRYIMFQECCRHSVGQVLLILLPSHPALPLPAHLLCPLEHCSALPGVACPSVLHIQCSYTYLAWSRLASRHCARVPRALLAVLPITPLISLPIASGRVSDTGCRTRRSTSNEWQQISGT